MKELEELKYFQDLMNNQQMSFILCLFNFIFVIVLVCRGVLNNKQEQRLKTQITKK